MAIANGTPDRQAASPRALLGAARTLNCDRITAEVVRAMDGAGITNILLKGPSIARWLYPAGGRTYGDTDLLVPASEFSRAQALLCSLGFVGICEQFHPFELSLGALRVERWFERPPGHRLGPAGAVDLHHNLPSFGCSDEALWDTLIAGHVETMTVGGAEVRILNRTALALHVVSHAVQHGYAPKTQQDLERVVPAITLEVWRSVAELAVRVGADEVLSVGLRHLPMGAAVADHLGLPNQETPPDGSAALYELWTAPSLSSKLRWIRWMLVPSAAKMQVGLKHFDDVPLWRSYVRRWGRIVTSLPAAVRFVTPRRHRPFEDPDATRRYS